MGTKITRKDQKIFASSASNNGQFGSAQVGTKVLSNDPDTIQSLTAYLNGWLDAVIGGNKLPPLEELQGLQYLMTYQLAYLFENGIPEYSSDDEYFTYSIVRKTGTYELYGSLVDNNIGNALPSAVDDANWKYLGDLSDIVDIPESSTQIGTVVDFAGPIANIPSGYLHCDGSAISRTTYANLFSKIGTYWGSGDGSTTFNLPDLCGKSTIGYDSADADFSTVGNTGGEKTHLLTSSESGVPAHTHPMRLHSSGETGLTLPLGTNNGYAGYTGNTEANSAADASSAHNNLHPYGVVLKIIKY